MKYDAMAIGNHEFDYGSDNFEKQMYRVQFPIGA
jgi:2',3'-cyclic-nucleotide 2'-phosphodiesterase (5'-nucleotidase family)